jgi:polyhydroxyalkanoate synthesis regulator phasin
MAEDEIDKLVNMLVKNKELSLSEGNRLKMEIVGYTNALKGWISESIDKRVGDVFDAMNLATNDDIKALSAKVDALAKKVKQLEKTTVKTVKKPTKKTASPKKKPSKSAV